MKYERECSICGNPTEHMYEVDVKVGIIKSGEPSICEDCYMSEDENIKKRVEELNNNYELAKENPFLVLGF